MAKYDKFTSLKNPDRPVQVESAIRDGSGKNIENNYAKQDGYYGTMGVGEADSAKSLNTQVGSDDQTPFSSTTVGIESDVETGIQELRKLVCVDVVRNQHEPDPNFQTPSRWSYAGGTGSVSGGVATFIGTTISGSLRDGAIRYIATHKYLIYSMIKTTTATNSVSIAAYDGVSLYSVAAASKTSWQMVMGIVTTNRSTSSGQFQPIRDNRESDWDEIQCSQCGVIDLTQRYGSNEVVNAIIGTGTGSEKVANLLAYDPEILKDIDYDAGTLVPSKTAKLKTVDYNQLKTVPTHYNNGIAPFSKNVYSYALPNKVYRFAFSGIGTATSWRLAFRIYDLNGNLITDPNFFSVSGGYTNVGWNSSIQAFLDNADNVQKYKDITFSQPCYIAFYFGLGTTTASMAMTEACFFLYWDGSRIGYEPYQEHIYDMPNYEGHGILKVVDGKVVADGTELYPDGNSKKRYGIADLSTLTFAYDSLRKVFYANAPSNMKAVDSNNSAFNGCCSKYIVDSLNGISYGTGFGDHNASIALGYLGSANQLCIRDDSLATSTTTISGTLVYELTAEEDIETAPYNGNPYMDDFGTMEFLDEDGNTIPGLQGCEIFYKANVAGFAESLYVKADGDPDAIALVEDVEDVDEKHDTLSAQLKNAVGGTLRQLLATQESINFLDTDCVDISTLTWTAYDGDYNIFYAYVPGRANGVKLLSTKYVKNSQDFSVWNNLNFSGNANNEIVYFKDNSSSTPAEFVANNKGVLLAYEKASS